MNAILTRIAVRTEKPFQPGQRIRVHPVSDWFIRGERYGVVTSVRRRPNGLWVVYARGECSGKRMKLTPDLILPFEGSR